MAKAPAVVTTRGLLIESTIWMRLMCTDPAWPALTKRLIVDLSAQDRARQFKSAWNKGVRSVSMATTVGNIAYTLPKISEEDSCADDTWTATTTSDAPAGRQSHTVIWTGSQMIVWGGNDGNDVNTGGRYCAQPPTPTPTPTPPPRVTPRPRPTPHPRPTPPHEKMIC